MAGHAKDTHIFRVHYVVYRILTLLARPFFVLDRKAVCAYNTSYQGNEEKKYPRPRVQREPPDGVRRRRIRGEYSSEPSAEHACQ